jgi:hypothetical protein
MDPPTLLPKLPKHGPNVHAAAADVVGQMIEIIEAPPFRLGIASTEPSETVVVD